MRVEGCVNEGFRIFERNFKVLAIRGKVKFLCTGKGHFCLTSSRIQNATFYTGKGQNLPVPPVPPTESLYRERSNLYTGKGH
jgi:hypothetical protein